MIRMQMSISNLVQIMASVAVCAAASALPAAAAVRHGNVHRASLHRIHHRIAARPLTIRRERVVAAPDPFHGPAAIITAPVALAGMIVGLPFQAIEAVFPPAANDPRVLVGAPVHVAGRLAQLPFYAVDSAFGVPPNYY
jgi:hypothetical protein